MELKNGFTVAAPVDEVWRALTDFGRVVPCVPGAELLEPPDETRCKARMSIRLGPMTLQYRGDVEVLEKDAEARSALLQVKARDLRGQGNARAQVRMRLEADGAGTRAELESDVQVGGRAAALGQGAMRDVAARLTGQFADNLAGLFDSPPDAGDSQADAPDGSATAPGAPLAAGSLLAGALRDRLARPATLAALLVAVAAVVYFCGAR